MTIQPANDLTWHHRLTSISSEPMEKDLTQSAAPRHARPQQGSLGRQLLRQRMFPTETTPTAIGRYLVLDFVGAGAMGEVFAAYDPVLDRKVALKLLPPALSGDHERRARLMREAQALAKLSHPNVVQVYEAGEHDERVFVVMEFVAGQTLAQWVESVDGGSRDAVILAKFMDAGRGLAAAHAAGLIHRDFKPSNVQVDAKGVARVLDFGLVAGLGEAPSPRLAGVSAAALSALDVELTQTGALLGTPGYMAPDQFLHEFVDARADQFGFCVALHEALTGARPFEGESMAELVENILAGRRAKPVGARALPRRISRALDRGLAAEPSDRWPSMDALLDALAPPVRARVALGVAAVVLPLVAVASWQVVGAYKRELDASAEQLAIVTEVSAVEGERADQLSEERELLEELNRAQRVQSLADTPGSELEALALGVEVLREHGLDQPSLPTAAFAGLGLALDGMVPLASLDREGRLLGAATLSADGELLVTTPAVESDNEELEVWATQPPRRLQTLDLDGLEVGLRAPVISADARRVAISSLHRCVVFDLDSGARVRELGECTDPHLSRDGLTLFGEIPCEDQSKVVGRVLTCGLAAWDVDSGARRWKRVLKGHEATVALHPQGHQLIVRHDYSAKEAIELLAADTGEREALLESPVAGGRYPRSMVMDRHFALSGDGSTLAVVDHSGDQQVVVWDLPTGTATVLDDLQPSGWGWAFCEIGLSQDGGELLIHGRGAGLGVYDLDRGRYDYTHSWGSSQATELGSGWVGINEGVWIELPRPRSRQAAAPAYRLVSSADGGFVVSVSGAGSRLWARGASEVEARTWAPPAGEVVLGFDAAQIVTDDKGGTLRVYPRGPEGEADEPSVVVALARPDRALAVARERPTRALIQVEDHLEVRDLGVSESTCRLPGDPGRLWKLSPDGRLAAVDRGAQIVIWDLDACEERERYELPAGTSDELWLQEFAADGVLHLRGEQGLNLIRRADGRVVQVDEQCQRRANASYAQLSPDGRLLLSSCDGTTPEHHPTRLWDAVSGELVRDLDTRAYRGRGQFSSDGALALFNAGRHQLALVDLAEGRERFRVPGQLPARPGGMTLHAVGEGSFEYQRYGAGLVRVPSTVGALVDVACELLGRSELAERSASSCARD